MAVVGTHLAFDADATALAIVASDGDGRYIDTATLHADDEAALAAWLADAGQPKALHEAKLAMHDLEGRGWQSPASRPTPRWPPIWCGPASAALPSTTCRCAT